MRLQYRQQVTFLGMLVGATLGAVAALVWLDRLAGEEIEASKATTVGFGDIARILTASFALVRQINEMAKDKEELEDES